MPEYRRLRIPGGRYFFTVNLVDRKSRLLTDRVADLRHAVRRVRALAPVPHPRLDGASRPHACGLDAA